LADAAGLVLTDALPTRVAFARWVPGEKPQGADVDSEGVLTWQGTVPAQDAVTFGLVAVHVGEYSDLVSNQAQYRYLNYGDSDRATFVVVDPPVLSITKGAIPVVDVVPSDTVTYSILLTNSGASSAFGVMLVDELPDEVHFVDWVPGSRPADAQIEGDTLSWTGTVEVGRPIEIGIVVSYTGGLGAVVTNTAHYTHVTGGGANAATFFAAEPHIPSRNPIYLPLVVRGAGR
jgi:uncharacterized repeat protein (TIGR01451 family)